MKRPVKWRYNWKKTRKERRRERKNVILKDAGISEATQIRYYTGLSRLLPFLCHVSSMCTLDETICNWIQKAFEDGESLYVISDALCGLHHFEPWTRKRIPESWKVFSIWKKLEAPQRAPPLTAVLVYAFANLALARGDLYFAALLCLGFFGLLRTGELLKVCANDLIVGEESAICRLVETKTGKRNVANEVVAIEDEFSLEVLRAVISIHPFPRTPIWLSSPQVFRQVFNKYCELFRVQHLNFRPYSLRRGGATHLFQETGSMETALVKGRWGSNRVARVYISDGLSYLPSLTFSRATKAMLKKWNPL